MTRLSSFFLLFTLLSACQTTAPQPKAEMLIINGNVMTMDTAYRSVDAIAIRAGKILALGTSKALMEYYRVDSTQILDVKGAFVMPGLIEGHGHFLSMGKSLTNLNLLHTRSWEEIVDSVKVRVARAKPGEWIYGRGWHQEKWDKRPIRNYFGYPDHRDLSAVSPDNPVLLSHASGHALFANKKAMELAGINSESPDPVGGAILRFSDGAPIGVFEENAMYPVQKAYQKYLNSKTPAEREQTFRDAVLRASKHCWRWGVTSFQDAGTTPEEYRMYQKWKGEVGVRLNVMLLGEPKRLKQALDAGILNAQSNAVSCHAIKAYFDGALGSYGAWMLESYADKHRYFGQNTTPLDTLQALSDLAAQHRLQFCVHAIGDRANRAVLDLVEEKIKAGVLSKDHRWRIEHAQHIDPSDIPRFHTLGVIASMQPVHCTSDAPFVVKRLGHSRAKHGAYPWRSLLDAGAKMAIGTDVPVEEINPFVNIYAAVTRRRLDNGMTLFPEQRMTREEILQGYTIWNAYAAREEKEKGSLTPGKWADIVVFSKDLSKCKENDIPHNKVIYTILGGNIVYERKKI